MNSWKTDDGRVISIKEMTDSHLLNTIKYLERKHRSIKSRALEMYASGRLAKASAQAYIDSEPAMVFPQLRNMYSEAARRGLDQALNGRDPNVSFKKRIEECVRKNMGFKKNT